jgi:CelD/BcsL family acetyltransferase involved in cellulose biosynthesis
MRHAAGALGWSAKAQSGETIAWPCRIKQFAPGLHVLESPRVPLYETHGGPEVPDAAAEELLSLLLQPNQPPQQRPDVLIARRIPAEGPIWEALTKLARSGAIALDPIVTWERAMLDRRVAPDAEAYLRQAVSGTRLKRLRQKRKALEKLGSLSLEVAEIPEAVAAAFETFCRLEAQSWKGRAGTALAQDAAGKAYVGGLLGALAPERNAFALSLQQDGRAIAASLFVRSGGEVVFWKTAYDETLSKHSPGVVLDTMVTEWLYQQPWFEIMDAGHDDAVDPNREIWAERRKVADVVIDMRPGSLKGRALVALLKARQELRAWKNRRQSAK